MSLVLLCAGTVGIDSIILSESEDRKVCSFYNLDSIPVVFVIDPITVKKKLFLMWNGSSRAFARDTRTTENESYNFFFFLGFFPINLRELLRKLLVMFLMFTFYLHRSFSNRHRQPFPHLGCRMHSISLLFPAIGYSIFNYLNSASINC